MKKIDEMPKQMPYTETDEYLDNLVERCTANAINAAKQETGGSKPAYLGKGFRIWPVVGLAAAAVLLFLFIARNGHQVEPDVKGGELIAQQSPIDNFLDGLTDDDLMTLSSYEVEDYAGYEYYGNIE